MQSTSCNFVEKYHGCKSKSKAMVNNADEHRSGTVAGQFGLFIDLVVVVLQGVFMTEFYCLSVWVFFPLYLCAHLSQQCITTDTSLFSWPGLTYRHINLNCWLVKKMTISLPWNLWMRQEKKKVVLYSSLLIGFCGHSSVPLSCRSCVFVSRSLYTWMARKSTGVRGFVACRTLASLRSPRRRSRLRFPVRSATSDTPLWWTTVKCTRLNFSPHVWDQMKDSNIHHLVRKVHNGTDSFSYSPLNRESQSVRQRPRSVY